MATPRTKAELTTMLADNTTGDITPSVMRDMLETLLRMFLPIGAWWENPVANLPAGRSNNFVIPNLQTHPIIEIHGADNQGTILTGIDATGILPGMVRILMDTQAAGQQDAGTFSLTHEDDDSLEDNRVICPNQTDYVGPPNGITILVRGNDQRWHVGGTNGRAYRAIVQSLQLYPKCRIGNVTPLSGTHDNWNPTGAANLGGLGVAGSDATFRNHSFIDISTDIAGARINGLEMGTPQVDPAFYGAVKVLHNQGPGDLVLGHSAGAPADAKNRMFFPQNEDVTLKAGETAWVIHAYLDPDTTQPGFRCIALAQNKHLTTRITVSGRTTTRQLTIATKDTPAQLAAHSTVTINWDPGSGAVAAANTHNNGSIIDGMVPVQPLVPGETKIVQNVGAGPLAIFNEGSGSDPDFRFVMPSGRPIVLPTRGSSPFRFDESGKWNLIGSEPEIPMSVSITPAALPASKVDNYSPTDATTGWPGRLAKVWRIQGQVLSAIGSIEATPAGLPAFMHGERILLINYGGSMLIKNLDSGADTGNAIRCPPGGANNPDYTLLDGASVWVVRDGIGNGWFLEGARV